MTKITFSKQLLTKVFGADTPDDTQAVSMEVIQELIDSKLEHVAKEEASLVPVGRLGPSCVWWDLCSNMGSLVIENDRLTVLSHSGFSSIKANVCVFKGKWQYEVMLNSKGVMQIGWATRDSQFSQEKGVGDTNHSYAYDGNRVRKWNVSTCKYGQTWQIGDCITCAIDLDIGSIDFYRNGQHLGTAFNKVPIGKCFAYFPAISLAYQESVVTNFGATPLRFPVSGYKPLESVSNELIRSGWLVNQWICNLVAQDSSKELTINQYLICNRILSKLHYIYANKYIIEECFLTTLFRSRADSIHSILTLMWTLMPDQQMHDLLESLIRSIINRFKFSPISLTRPQCTRHLNFDLQKNCLSGLKSLEDESLTSVLFADMTVESFIKEDNLNNIKDQGIESAAKEVECLQDKILYALLFEDDISRTTFVKKLENFVKESATPCSRSQVSHQLVASLHPVIFSLFQRLTHVIRSHLKDAISFIGATYFADISNANDNSRLGGMASYLQKQNKDHLSVYLDQSVSLSPLMKDMYVLIDSLVKMFAIGANKHLTKLCSVSDQLEEYIKAYKDIKGRFSSEPRNEANISHTLNVLEERIIALGRQLVLINSIELNRSKKESIYWLFTLVLNTLQHSSSCGHLFPFVPDYFIETLISLFSSIRFYFITPSSSSDLSKQEYESLLGQYSSFIASHFCDPRITIADIKDNLSQALASLVSNRETLRALESISFEQRIKLVTCLCKPYENRAWAQTNWTLLRFWKGSGFGYRYTDAPKSIRCNANASNRIGCPINKDHNSLNYLSPHPSVLYQSLIGEYLKSEPESAMAFISSLLSQLNWTFSEFIGMLQEIQNSVNRPQKVFIDSRQLKICSTCFELTLALLRVLEMIVCVNPELITLSPSNQMISVQFNQIICQILNRLTITGCFDFVIGLDIQELDSISHFQVLSAGILIALTTKGSQRSREEAIRSITSEPSFLSESLFFLIGEQNKSDSTCKTFSLTDFDELNDEEKCALKQMILSLTLHVKDRDSTSSGNSWEGQEVGEDQLCTICYADKKVAIFSCGHKSCRSCIALHFLRNGEKCFFCKAIIERVVFDDSDEILYPKNV